MWMKLPDRSFEGRNYVSTARDHGNLGTDALGKERSTTFKLCLMMRTNRKIYPTKTMQI